MFLDLFASQEAIGTDTVVESDDDDVFLRGLDQGRPVVVRVRVRRKPATLDPKKDRQLGTGTGCPGGGVDI